VLQALHVAERGSQHLVKTVHSTITNDYQKHTVSATHGGAKTTMRKGWTSGAAAMTRRVTWRRVNHGSARCGGGAATALAHGAIRPGGPWRNLAEPIDRGSAAARASGARAVARPAGRHALMAGPVAGERGADGRLSSCLLGGRGAGKWACGHVRLVVRASALAWVIREGRPHHNRCRGVAAVPAAAAITAARESIPVCLVSGAGGAAVALLVTTADGAAAAAARQPAPLNAASVAPVQPAVPRPATSAAVSTTALVGAGAWAPAGHAPFPAAPSSAPLAG